MSASGWLAVMGCGALLMAYGLWERWRVRRALTADEAQRRREQEFVQRPDGNWDWPSLESYERRDGGERLWSGR